MKYTPALLATLVASARGAAVDASVDSRDEADVDLISDDVMTRIRQLNGQPASPQHDLGELGHRARRQADGEVYGTVIVDYGVTMHIHKDICVNEQEVNIVANEPEDYWMWRQCCPMLIPAAVEPEQPTTSLVDCPVWMSENCETLEVYTGDYTFSLWTDSDLANETYTPQWFEDTSYWWNTHQKVEQFGHCMNRITNIFHMANAAEPMTFTHLISSRQRSVQASQHLINLIGAVLGGNATQNTNYEETWWRDSGGLRQIKKADRITHACMRRALDLDWGTAERTMWNNAQKQPWNTFINKRFPDAIRTEQTSHSETIPTFPTGIDTRVTDPSWNITYIDELRAGGGTVIPIPVDALNITDPANSDNLFCAPPKVGVLHRIEGSGNRTFEDFSILERVLERQGISTYDNFTVWSGNSSEEQIGAFRSYGLLFAPFSSQSKNSAFFEGIMGYIEVQSTYPGYINVSPFSMGPDLADVYFVTSEAHLPNISSCPESHGCTSQKQYKTNTFMLEYLLTTAVDQQLERLRTACTEWQSTYPRPAVDPTVFEADYQQSPPLNTLSTTCAQSGTDCEIWNNVNQVCMNYNWWAVEYCADYCGIECTDSFEF
ncbi:hypothetical protein SARC_04347 [Sphaeroforma arctica JP610]|uniref:ShKT domain-containing protein n=1 Tax=Sphaeroforma arctica JP610 TaxID=667725 RepID=A0A0L0G3J0_9EUKA|nr:hypothetical protein SARC_04347 [Sphaeroforma arctica JP610]KNC83406.1 hypothetical protein SARC_04347 [Sphaeroforma arctica JP610]|eukprot:XP_014157308.1 hypothetical protein SARC_04347 [Sphaeroforma arctica JP610]